ncbi:restriction endonuclease subunit S [Brevibacterium sp. UMB1308A]|uniref:restriction endonuclease subunit S n=1 Tax=Brevibacterium sp. UMB1308A TaxID=3050608 RepID=UPI0025518CD3|nr:restriction endonuclease subunit S [Brevibacterium sp. UMB1308A]MDK8345718.1 restriction endonuclease subunit S [Brevibacterium sp. UMB1308B]MDK8713157.1 restriction endonuclease subunit S [Brevibacterium sp. UMB1308A]
MTRWQSVPFHTLFRRVPKRTGFPAEELLSVYREYGVIRKSDRDDNFNRPGNLNDYQLVKTGDLVLNKMKAWQGALGISPHTGIVSPAYFVYTPVSDNDESFLHYALRCRDAIDYYAAHSTGIRVNQWDVSPERLDAMPVPVPDLATQRRIADYLDKEISEMDALIEEFEGLVASLESRQRVFATKLVQNCDYPLVPLSTLVSVVSGDSIESDFIKAEGKFPVYGGNGIRGYTDSSNCDVERILVGRQGALCGNVHLAKPDFFATEHALIVKPRQEVDLVWLEHTLRELNLGELSTSVAQPGITATKVLLQRVKLPPIREQRRIGRILQDETARMDSLIEESTRLIENLKARKTALITEVVTGRKEV